MSLRPLTISVATSVSVAVLGLGAGAAVAQEKEETPPTPAVLLGAVDHDDDDEDDERDDDDDEGKDKDKDKDKDKGREATPPPPSAPPPPVAPAPGPPSSPAGPTTPARPRPPFAARNLIGDHLLLPSTGRVLGGVQPTFRWRGGPADVRVYNVQVFTADRRKVMSAFSARRALRAPTALPAGRRYIWRVWPFVRGRGYTARPLGLSWFATPSRAALAADRA